MSGDSETECSMVERVARAIHPDKWGEGTHGSDCVDCEEGRDYARLLARLAIKAMRDPPERVWMEAGGAEVNGEVWSTDYPIIFNAVIDAALKEHSIAGS